MTELISEIRSVEDKASKIIEDAERQSNIIIKKANDNSIKIMTDKKMELSDLKARSIESARKESLRIRHTKIKETQALLDSMRDAAGKKENQAVTTILAQLEKIIGE